MLRSLCTVRKAAVSFIAVMSVVFAVFLVWHLVTPGSIARVDVGALLAVLALFILPAATAAAWELDRRALRRIPESELEAELEEAAPERRVHPAGTPSRSHRRLASLVQPPAK